MADKNPFLLDLSKYTGTKPTQPLDLRTFIPNKEEDKTPEINWRPWAAGLIRGGSGFLGSEGLLPGAVIAGGGELLAQGAEGRFNPYSIGTAAAIGAVPFGSSAKLLPTIAKGAALSGVGTAAMQQAEEGLHTPTVNDLSNIGFGTALGAAGGGIGYGLGRFYAGKKGIPDLKEEPTSPVKPTGTEFRTNINPIESGVPPTSPVLSNQVSTGTGEFPVTLPADESPTVKLGKRNKKVPKVENQEELVKDLRETLYKIQDEAGIPRSKEPLKRQGLDEFESAALGKEPDPELFQKKADDNVEVSSEGDKGKITIHSGIGMKVDLKPVIQILSKLYEGDIGTIAAKELVQNSLDNVRPLGKNGLVKVFTDNVNKEITVIDNGTGMTPDQLKTVYTTLGMKGKDAKEGIGGYGVAKAAFQMGGERFTIETTAKDTDGVIRRSSFSATPDDFIDHKVNIVSEEMPPGTPTGTNVKVKIPAEENTIKAEAFVKNVGKYSGTEGKLHLADRWADYQSPIPNYEEQPNNAITSGKFVDSVEDDVAKANISIPDNAVIGDHDSMSVILTNRGMYQGEYSLKVKGNQLPSEIVVDIASKVDALDKKYPFVPSRERLQGDFATKLGDMIKDKVINPARGKRKAQLTQLYDNIPTTGFKNASRREFTFLDPKGRINDKELKTLETNPILNKLSLAYSTMVDHLVSVAPDQFAHWNDHIKKIGFMMTEPGFYGLHLANPSNMDEGQIFVNPFNHFIDPVTKDFIPPAKMVGRLTHTIVHEVAHSPSRLGYGLTAHENAAFEQAIGDLFENATFTLDPIKKAILGAVSDDGKTYTAGVEDLLRFYKDAAGRSGTKADLLSGEGIKSEHPKSSMEEAMADYIRSTGKRTTTSKQSPGPVALDPTDQPTIEMPKGFFSKAYHTARKIATNARQLQSSMDLSFPFRQGATGTTYSEFWKSFGPMFRSAASEGNFAKTMREVENHPLFDLAKESGLDFTHLGKDAKAREEDLRGEWIENWIPGVRASNRGFTAFGNKLRMDLFSRFVKNAANAGVDLKDSKNSTAIAKLINDMTGRGDIPFGLEKVAPQLNEVIFSPKLISSRINMFRRAFQDPSFYNKVDPKLSKQLRMEALRGMSGIGGMALLMGGLSAAKFGKPEAADPRSGDFGKLKIGNTRIDMTGGFQQYVRTAAQMVSGMANVEGNLDKRNRLDTGERFIRNKLSPIASLITDMMAGKDVVGNDVTPARAAYSRTTPLILQDLVELAQEDKKMIPYAMPASFFGGGVSSYERNEKKSGRKSGSRSKSSIGRYPSLNLDKYTRKGP